MTTKTELDPNFEYRDDKEFARRMNWMLAGAVIAGACLALAALLLLCYFFDFLNR